MYAEFGILRERQNNLYFSEYENDSGRFHFHSQMELYFIDDGEMEVFINNQRRVLKKGEMSVSLGYDAHGYKTVNYSKSSVLIIPAYMCEEFYTAIDHKKIINPFICDVQTVQKMKACFHEIKSESGNAIKQLGYIYIILGILLESVCFQPACDKIESELSSKILLYIHDHYKQDITLATLSAKFGYSPSYISRYFKSCFHIGLNQYLSIIRLKNAVMLMLENKYSMTYCALESGFNSMRTFYRTFYKEFACSPKEYLEKKKTI